MSTSKSTIDFLLDMLADGGQISVRKMFGEYCLYYAGRPVGLVCNDQLYLKPGSAVQALVGTPQFGEPYPGARPHLLITADYWEDRVWLYQLVRTVFEQLPPPKPASRKKSG